MNTYLIIFSCLISTLKFMLKAFNVFACNTIFIYFNPYINYIYKEDLLKLSADNRKPNANVILENSSNFNCLTFLNTKKKKIRTRIKWNYIFI